MFFIMNKLNKSHTNNQELDELWTSQNQHWEQKNNNRTILIK